MTPESAIYRGTLRHRRFVPRRHEFSYPLFMVFADIDQLPELMARSPFSSYGSWNWASFDQRDHFGDPALSLRERLERDASAQGVTLPRGRIFLLTHLRYLGYCFNPISLFYCYDEQGTLQQILAEVHSTFGEIRNYWLTDSIRREAANSRIYRCPKTMHVSPFMAMNLDYEFVLTDPAEHLTLHMNTHSPEGRNFDATLTLEREDWNHKNLIRLQMNFQMSM